MTTSSDLMAQRLARLSIRGYALLGIGLAAWLFLLPGLRVARDVLEVKPTGDIPAAAWRLERSLTPRYEQWARARLGSDQAGTLSLNNVSGTEWPLFGSVFYLWSMESLQRDYEQERAPYREAPAVRGRAAIEAATALVIDPRQAAWVQKYWGDDYLKRENVFYRMMVIAALTSHARLTGSTEHLDLLRSQVESLSQELGQSQWGLLDDYPMQCYPGDVLAAISAIKAADEVLGTSHSAFVAQAQRGFQGCRLDHLGLVPYNSNARLECTAGVSRGCGNSYASLTAPLVWPEIAAGWYDRYREHFLQESWGAVGFREFAKGAHSPDWYMDVDSGPVLAGHGIAASAFGVGAARTNGRFDDAYPLTLEMLATSWPLPDDTLAMPALLSNASDAPLLGESAILYNLTRVPAPGIQQRSGGKIPPFVLVVIGLYLAAGALLAVSFIAQARGRERRFRGATFPEPWLQVAGWTTLLAGVLGAFLLGHAGIALVLLLVMGRIPYAAPRDA